MILSNYKFNSNNISYGLLIIFPLCLVIGPFVAELAMNLISAIFLYKLYQNKNYKLFKISFFIYFVSFYFYIVINSGISNYYENIFIKNIFYFRHIIFVVAVLELLLLNEKLIIFFHRFLILTFFFLVIDGYVQFFFDYNLLGYPRFRPDRISGLFEEDLILGSYLSRLIPLIFGLFFYNYKNLSLKEKIINMTIVYSSFFLIFLTGERVALIFSIGFLLAIFILTSLNKYLKIFFFTLILFSSFAIMKSEVIYDRIYNQTVKQVNFKFSNENFFENFKYYSLIYQTAFNGFKEKKLMGQGAGSYRYYCSNDNISVEKTHIFESTIAEILFGTKTLPNDVLFPVYLVSYKKNPKLSENKKLSFQYKFRENIKNFNNPNFRLITKNFNDEDIGNRINEHKMVIEEKRNGCTNHPHNFYLQLLSETGIIGFLFLVILLIYFSYKILKQIVLKIFYNSNSLSNSQICSIIGFLLTIFPLFPNGNFFNNWMCMIMYFQIPFYIFYTMKNSNDKTRKNKR